MKANISEIFRSIQGEGIFRGQPQVFIRFSGCNLKCSFCDTDTSLYREMSLQEVLTALDTLPRTLDSVALTGGEPLLWASFIKELAPHLKERNFSLYLETNGTLPQSLESVIDFIDVVAMDIKLPSSTGLRPFWQEHEDFLSVAGEKKVFAKCVITASTETEDVIKASCLIRKLSSSITLVLQPQYSQEGVLWPKLESFRHQAKEVLEDVRIITQLHKAIGVR